MAGIHEMLALWFRMLITPAMREEVPEYDPEVDWEARTKEVYERAGMPYQELLDGEVRDLSPFTNLPLGIKNSVITHTVRFDEELAPDRYPKKYADKSGAHTLLMLIICASLQGRTWKKSFQMVGFDVNLLCYEFKQKDSDGWYEMYCVALLATKTENRLNEWLKKPPVCLISDKDLIELWGEENKNAMNEHMEWLMDDICPP